jgi:hypothetical protein
MSNPWKLALILAAVSACVVNAQSPTDSHTTKVSYVNTYFKFAYTWPAMLKPSTLPSPDANGTTPRTYEFPLFIAREVGQPYGVVIVAQKLGVAGPHSTPLTKSGDLIDRIAHSLRPGPILSDITRSEKKNEHGMVFDELSYLQSGKPSSVIATQVGEYLIVFKCNARSAAEMRAMENSVWTLSRHGNAD